MTIFEQLRRLRNKSKKISPPVNPFQFTTVYAGEKNIIP